MRLFFSKIFKCLKRVPLSTEYMLMKPEGSPFDIFRHYATFFSERKKFKNQVFFKKSLLRFLSLRYSADFRRSRLVYYCSNPCMEHARINLVQAIPCEKRAWLCTWTMHGIYIHQSSWWVDTRSTVFQDLFSSTSRCQAFHGEKSV